MSGFLRIILVVAALATFPSRTLQAQGTYPTRPITMIVPFPPGGVADQTGRPVAAAMEKILKQPVVVSNRPGAGGAVGMSLAANAKPDGYTILMALSSISIIPEADKLFGRQPTYRMDQLAPVALVTADPTVLMVRADSPWKTVKDFVEDARKRPGEISFSSSGIYGTLHMAMEMFAHSAGIKLKHVPFSGAGPAMTALLGNHVQAFASGPSVVLPQIQAGKLRPLAVWGDKRVAALPDVPTFKELGFKDVEFYIWSGLFAPAGTPEPIMKTLRDTMRMVVADPDFKSAMEKLQTPVDYRDAPEFKEFWDKDAAELARAVQRVGRIEGAQ
ncbi:MAG: tripartite tricarboxylate transporter substrate binding protein [Hyphomicrobiaceae bacterium]|nr:MAG: tripartite tricarboxylate transporter substrate binding protein [Hyphomicrobiaceae bacterium]